MNEEEKKILKKIVDERRSACRPLSSLFPELTDGPGDFPEYGEGLATEHECPKCGYAWS